MRAHAEVVVERVFKGSARAAFRQRRGALNCGVFLLTALPIFAQTALTFGESAKPLNGPWMFHPGDNPEWAQPGWDESRWTPLDLTASGRKGAVLGYADFVPGWTARGFAGLSGYAWYRLAVRLEDPARDLRLLMPDMVDDAYEIYADGRLVGGFGRLRPGHEAVYSSHAMSFAMPHPRSDGILHLAVRVYMLPSTPLVNPDAGGMHAAPLLGLPSTIRALRAKAAGGYLRNYLNVVVLALPMLLFALLAVGLFLFRSDQKAFLWLGLTSATTAFSYVLLASFSLTFSVTTPPYFTISHTCTTLVAMGWLMFWISWFGLEKRRYLWIVGALVTLVTIASICIAEPPFPGWVAPAAWIHNLRWIRSASRTAMMSLLAITGVLGIKKDRREGWLALPPLLLWGVGLFYIDLLVLHIRTVYFPFGIQVTLGSLATLVCFMATGALLIRRLMRQVAVQARLQQEVNNARQLQQVLVPAELPRVANYAVDAVYLPAQVVGGDFFQAIPLEDGSLLAVVGDVSGKGIPAAMVVALVIGTLRTAVEFTTAPAAVLGILNERLTGRMRSGFATCLVSRLSPSGELSLANAGHLAPYLNGRELEVEPDVPVGLAATIEYAESHWQLKAGDRLTFLTDGVVEARSAAGELFGFDRTKEISVQPAQTIADAARAFGQDDDITVLAIGFEPVGDAVL